MPKRQARVAVADSVAPYEANKDRLSPITTVSASARRSYCWSYPLYLWLGTVTQPGNINYPIAVFIIFILVCYVGMVYGPVGAFLAEYFPGRIRYTSVSVPYHIGNGWGGGLVPFITSAAFAATGSIGYALIYPIVVPAVCFVLALFLMPETRKISIWEPIEPRTAS
jgi:hypothetical protein